MMFALIILDMIISIILILVGLILPELNSVFGHTQNPNVISAVRRTVG